MNKFISLISILFLFSCTPKTTDPIAETPTANSQEYLVAGTIFTQHAAEYRALCFQAYNLAEMRLLDILKSNPEKPAVVLDLDETVLDNSAFTAWQITSDTPFSEDDWAIWTSMAVAPEVPGVTRFLKLADSLGVTLFYVSNRDSAALHPTIKNMRNLRMPQLGEEHFMLKTTTSGKESRRQAVRDAGYNIVLLVGDNLGDFHHRWDKQQNDVRNHRVDSLKNEFGQNFIVLPNTLYGTWEGAIYNFDWSLSNEKRDSLRKAALEPAQIKKN
jgi:5'-nucleotidase (lipoprotein e(P4) family)